jgi:serine O-acetyltransferase
MTNKKENDSPYYQFAKNLLDKRETHSCNASLKTESILFFNELKDFLFPHFSNKVYYVPEEVIAKMRLIERNLITLLKINNGHASDIDNKAHTFISKLPAIHDMLWEDADAILKGDPAAESIDEVILAYPGFMAIFIFRIAHELYKLKIPIIPRILTEHAHEITGIDIHPGADIDSPFFIDHGTGIVIGETTVIGKNVKIYQGVTLGALSVDKSLVNSKRHPTIEDDVIIYSQAVILGGETVVGKNSIVGGNAWVTQSVPPNSVIYSKSEVRVRSNEQYFDTLEYII